MKKTVSVREFRAYCEKNRPHHILFYTENQSWYRASDPCKIKMSFPIMLICENPKVITVFCGNTDADGYEIAYTLVAAS